MQIKTSLYRPTLQKNPYICNRIENTLPKTYQKEALCLSQSRERRKFKTYSEREHSGSRAIAWAAITISVLKVFPTTSNLDVALQFHAS